MEKRDSRRVLANLSLKYPCRGTLCSGTAVNLSESGMFINTDMIFPVQSRFNVLIPLTGSALKVPVKISRLVKKGNVYNGMGVELLDRPKEYLDFLIKLDFKYKA